MRIGDLIDKLYEYPNNMEIALGNLKFDCCDKNIHIEEYYVDSYNELYNKEDYCDEEWEGIIDDLKRIIVLV